MNKYGKPTQTLSEGIYKVEDGYEYIGNYNGNIVIQKKPEFNEYDFVVFNDNWYGILKRYQYNNNAEFYVDFSCHTDSWEHHSIGFHRERMNVCCDDMRLATEDERQFIIDVMHAFGLDYKPMEYNKFINYHPNNYSYGISIKSGKFAVTKITDDNISTVLDEAYETYKFETERAAKICADILNERNKR